MSKLFILFTILVILGLAACNTEKDEPMLLGEKLTQQTLPEARPSIMQRDPNEERLQASNEEMQRFTLESD